MTQKWVVMCKARLQAVSLAMCEVFFFYANIKQSPYIGFLFLFFILFVCRLALLLSLVLSTPIRPCVTDGY